MADTQLPSRAKPEVLYEVCSALDSRKVERSTLYDALDWDRRQISAATDYGAKLGFLELEEQGGQTPHVALADHGFTLSHADSIDEPGVKNAFQSAIRGYGPYRVGLLSVHLEDGVAEVNGQRAVNRDALLDSVNKYVEGEVNSRQINLLLKTAQAAGLGNRKVGRHNYQTRLVVNAEFDRFVESLADEYTLPPKVEKDESEQKEAGGDEELTGDGVSIDGGAEANGTSGDKESHEHAGQIIAELKSGDLTLHIDLDISDKEDEEVLEIVNEIQSLA